MPLSTARYPADGLEDRIQGFTDRGEGLAIAPMRRQERGGP